MEVSGFVDDLKEFYSDRVENIEILLEGLKELDEIVGMASVKNSIILQIKFLLTNMKEKKLDGHMVHTVLSGPPGVGKTELGKVLAKIWLGLGILKTPKQSSDDGQFQREIKNLKLSGRLKNDVIKKLQEYCKFLKAEVKELDFKETAYRLRSLRRSLLERGQHDVIPEIETLLSEFKDIHERVDQIAESEISEENVHFWTTKNKSLVDLTIEKVPEFIPRNTQSQSPIKIVSREDFVAGYLGQTALKTEKLLQENLGKVLFIDEAYSLINSETDSFGAEALTVLNRYMSEYSDQLIVIFAGYSDMLSQTIFKAQPGLKRRCAWNFEIPGYSPQELSKIFRKQVEKDDWSISSDLELDVFFIANIDRFPHYGGSTSQFAFFCKLAHSEKHFGDVNASKLLTLELLNRALELTPKKLEKTSHHHMYM